MAEEHFARNEELLDRFVLGTMEEAERTRCERHLDGCSACRQAVEDEKRIVAGIKRYGRGVMKDRLRQATGTGTPVRTQWTRIIGVAAALIVITGIGIIYRWRELNVGGPERAATELRTEEPARPVVVSPGAASPSGAVTDKVANAPALTESKGLLNRRERNVTTLSSNEPVGTKSSQMAAAKPLEPPQAKLEKDRGQDNLQQFGLQKEQIRQSFWVQGVPIPSPSTFGPSARTKVMRETERADANAVTSGAPNAVGGGVEEAQAQGVITLDQRPARSLPLQQQAKSPGIITEVEARDDRTVMTLYLDTLLDPPSVRAARVRYVGRDSLIVIVGGKMIGYRMPAGWPGTQDTSRQITR